MFTALLLKTSFFLRYRARAFVIDKLMNKFFLKKIKIFIVEI